METPKCFEMEGKHPLGELDANVAFTTKSTAAIVTPTRRRIDQFRGFSTSPGLKLTYPSSLRVGGLSSLKSFVLYGLLTGREKMREMADISRVCKG